MLVIEWRIKRIKPKSVGEGFRPLKPANHQAKLGGWRVEAKHGGGEAALSVKKSQLKNRYPIGYCE
jgi:hypothetical protein